MKVWVAVDVGCIECGESSTVLGVFTNQTDAERVAEAAEKEQEANWTGQHNFFVAECEVE